MALVKVGVIALRSPSGEFLPEAPIYKELPGTDPESEYLPLDELADIFADKYKAFRSAERNGGRISRKPKPKKTT